MPRTLIHAIAATMSVSAAMCEPTLLSPTIKERCPQTPSDFHFALAMEGESLRVAPRGWQIELGEQRADGELGDGELRELFCALHLAKHTLDSRCSSEYGRARVSAGGVERAIPACHPIVDGLRKRYRPHVSDRGCTAPDDFEVRLSAILANGYRERLHLSSNRRFRVDRFGAGVAPPELVDELACQLTATNFTGLSVDSRGRLLYCPEARNLSVARAERMPSELLRLTHGGSDVEVIFEPCLRAAPLRALHEFMSSLTEHVDQPTPRYQHFLEHGVWPPSQASPQPETQRTPPSRTSFYEASAAVRREIGDCGDRRRAIDTTVSFDPDGAVRDVRLTAIHDDDPLPPSVGACVERVLRTIRIPAFRGPDPFEVHHQFVVFPP